MDFVVQRDAHSLHVLNGISPAFTSAFALAEMLVAQALNPPGSDVNSAVT